jgi:hypothetical protein
MRSACICAQKLSFLIVFLLSHELAVSQEAEGITRPALVQAEFGILPFGYAGGTTVQQLKALQTGDENLYRDFSAYEKNYGVMYYNNFPGQWYAGFSYFRQLRFKKGLSWSAGLKYHQVYLGGQGYSFNETFARDTFYNAQGQGIVEYELFSDGVYFKVSAHELMVPVSLYWSGKKERLIWIEAGVQFLPGIMFASRYDYFEYITQTKILSPLGKKPEDSHVYSPDNISYSQKTVTLNGSGFSLNAGLPVTLYLRASRRHKVFSRIHVFGNITPLFRVSYYPGLTSQQYTTTAASFGLRYRL